MQKRGQVTIFIILGIVVVVALAMVFVFKSEITEFFSELGEGKVIVPEQLQPIQTYLDECVGDITSDGIDILASQGGYINIPEDVAPRERNNIFSNSLQIFPGYEIAYWFYEDLYGNQVSQVPSIDKMEQELENYVLSRFDECVEGINYYNNLGYETEFGSGENVDVDIGKENVNVQVRKKINVEYKGVGDSWSKHTKDVEVPLGFLYEKAVDLMNQENSDLWLENKTMDQIILYDFPYDDVDFTCSAKIWNKNELEENFKQYLTFNVPFYKVAGSDYDSYYYDEPLFIWGTGKNFNDINVLFEYNKEWPIDFDVDPSQGSSVISRPISGGMGYINLCVNYESFFYDIRYPMLITLVEDDLEFSFADLVIVRKNKAREVMEEEIVNRIDYCEATYNEVEVDVMAYENDSFSGLERADVFYNCVAFNCYIGRTDSGGNLKKKFPLCANGVLEVRKDGYVEEYVTLTTFEGGDDYVSLWLDQIVDLDYSVKVKEKSGNSLGEARSLADDEIVLLEVTKQVDDRIEYGYAGIYPDEKNNLGLFPDIYHVKSTLIKESKVVIPSETIEICKCPEVLGACLCGKESYEVPESELESVVLGGAEYDWVVNRDNLNNNEIVFYVISNGVPNDYEDLKENFDLDVITTGFYDQIKPEFK